MGIRMADDKQLTTEEAASEQGPSARSAQAQAATLGALRLSAGGDDREEGGAGPSRSGLYLLVGIVLASLVVLVMWLGAQGP